MCQLIMSPIVDSKLEDLSLTVEGIQDKVSNLETEIAFVQDK